MERVSCGTGELVASMLVCWLVSERAVATRCCVSLSLSVCYSTFEFEFECVL